jgi:anti-sigma factor RsiW
MTRDHLSESEIQQYALEPVACEAGVAAHVNACAACKANVAAYQVLFTDIQEQPVPAFDFDIAAVIVPQIEKAKPVTDRFFISMAVITVISLSVAVYSFRSYFETIFTNALSWFIGIIVVAAISIIIFQLIELYKKYNQEMDQLQFE